jgi:protein SCO1
VAPNSTPAADAASAAPGLWKTFVASTAVLVLGLVWFWHATAAGNAFTTETLRRAEVAQAPRPLPDLLLLDATGRPARLPELLAAGPRVWIVDFVYTRCQTVCSALGGVYQQLQQQIVERGLQDRVGLVSISFDPLNDDPAALRDYAERLRIDPAVWRVATLSQPGDRRALLDAFGIMVIPAPLGEFEHNAALHVVRGGRLVSIVDHDLATQVIDEALAETP